MANRGFLVGINDYPGQPLHGCVNDVNDMADFLVASCHFESDNIRLLTDSRATTTGILERLRWLLTGVQPGDRLFFHYSGHGTRFPVRDAQGNVSKLYDAICPVDFDWTREHAIINEDLQQIFDAAPAGIEFIFVSDSCNSGDLTRGFQPSPPRYLVPPADIEWRLRTARDKRMATTTIQHDRCGLISGCKSTQESADAMINGRPNGALTYYLLQELKTSGALKQPLTQVVPEVVQLLKKNHYRQEPQLRGPKGVTQRAFLATAARGQRKKKTK